MLVPIWKTIRRAPACFRSTRDRFAFTAKFWLPVAATFPARRVAFVWVGPAKINAWALGCCGRGTRRNNWRPSGPFAWP